MNLMISVVSPLFIQHTEHKINGILPEELGYFYFCSFFFFFLILLQIFSFTLETVMCCTTIFSLHEFSNHLHFLC